MMTEAAPDSQPFKTNEEASVHAIAHQFGATVETSLVNACGVKIDFPHTATYSPQDDKIRLYFAFRLPRPEWDALRAAGFVWCMKQAEAGGCDMAAAWTPEREDIALGLAGEIDDEDQPREERAANFSPDRRYRYSLCRDIEPRFDRVMVCCGLNPSIADEVRPDPTITRVIKLARRELCRWLIMVNAYPFVATDPKDLERCHSLDRDGERNANEDHIRAALDAVILNGGVVLAAWGAHPLANAIGRPWLHCSFRDAGAKCLAINKDGSPKHPLYCRADAPLIPWKVAA